MMATYNGEKYIREQINSILNQSFKDWKLFISDDCSSDNTLSIIQDYSDRYPEKVCILNSSKKFGGAKKNFSHLFEACPRTELYMFSDQDDVWLPNKIELLVNKYDETTEKNKLVFCDLRVVDSNLYKISDEFVRGVHYSDDKSFVLMNNYIPGCVMLFDDELRRNVSTIPAQCYMHDWWITMYATYFGKIVMVNDSLNVYRQHLDNTLGAQKHRSFLYDIKNCFKHSFDNPVARYKRIIELSITRLKKRKRQNRKFLYDYGCQLDNEDKNIFGIFLRLCNRKYRIIDVYYYLKYFKIDNVVDNIVFMFVIFTKKI